VGAVRFHDLRHTAASIWLAAGVEIYKVSRWLGHANISTTDTIYAHLYATDHTADAARLGQWLGRSANP
jgi:integrase